MSPKRKPSTERAKDGALSFDIDFRLKGTGPINTPKIIAAFAALATLLGWFLNR